MRLLILTPQQATTVDASPTLNPRQIVGGPEAGNSAVNPAVLTDPTHEAFWPVLSAGREVELDLGLAWPAEPD